VAYLDRSRYGVRRPSVGFHIPIAVKYFCAQPCEKPMGVGLGIHAECCQVIVDILGQEDRGAET
jgi:hypothetical protein